MIDERELVIRWLKEPLEATCALCKSKKPKKFDKGPAISGISGELICLSCAYKHEKNLWSICSSYSQDLIGQDYKMVMDNIRGISNDKDDFIKHHIEDLDYPTLVMNDDFKLDRHPLDYDLFPLKKDGLDKCSKCRHTFHPKDDSKSYESK